MGLGQGPERKLKGVFMIVVDDSSTEEWYRGHGVRKLGRVREREGTVMRLEVMRRERGCCGCCHFYRFLGLDRWEA